MRACLLLVRLSGMSMREVQALPLTDFHEWLELAVELEGQLGPVARP